ncbi:MAG: DNA-3-methyladenine glycosylase 2 family protein [Immundisolibacteraceae bacterium]|nr:DNA-3-methyladenine glycosylase 2 family protein [Immundisolibacteraceae bacterium]
MTYRDQNNAPSPELTALVRKAEIHLSEADPQLGQLIHDLGPCPLANYVMDPFDSLVWTVIGQQISSAAAASITARLREIAGGGIFTPTALDQLDTETLRSAGLTRNKTRTLQEISTKIIDGDLDMTALNSATDDEVMQRLCQYYGIGPWTVEMLLMFGLGRIDVFSGGDLALRKAIGLLYEHDSPPDAAESNKIAQRWAPYRTVASWYLWRTVDPLSEPPAI